MNESIKNDVQIVIKSLQAMAFDAPESLSINVNYRSLLPSCQVSVLEVSDEDLTDLISEVIHFDDAEKALKQLLAVESKLAELVIKSKDDLEAAA
ncbi:MAG: hypothetical protein JKY55_04020 [Aliivibrio sp.]|uniref:hypothetical protein n=1 Tax=Aliivibrio sp. TaxID=1872443 RepID=UPI001A4D46EB|nr:hypothetical protein [Aliivibrio sp.]